MRLSPALFASVLMAALPAPGQERYSPVHRLTFEEYSGTLQHWRKTHRGLVTVQTRGLSGRNLPVYLLKITDSSVPDADKQVCLVTALHSGPERTGTTGALALAEWLLSDDPLAVETRRRQVVLFLPVVNPLAMFHTDRFGNERGVDPYSGNGPGGKVWDVKSLALLKPEDAPELAAVISVIDEFRPEVHADLHGTGLQEYARDQLGTRRMYRGQIMTEITGSAYSNYALRPWDWRVTEAMIDAGRAEGFPSDRFEADAQRTFWGPELAPLAGKLWHGMPMFYTAHYGYAKYHTLILTHEVAWEQSLVARMKGLLRIGNGAWQDENVPGYPVNRIRHFVGHYVTSCGTTAEARRASRIELWNRQGGFALGFLYPQTEGRESLVAATTAEARRAVAADDFPSLVANLKGLLGGKADAIERFIQAGPELKLVMEIPKAQLLAPPASAPASDPGAKPASGIGFRLRLPCAATRRLEVQLNGEPLPRSAPDGFESWTGDGFTQVQVNVPAHKTPAAGLYFLTCDYEPATSPPAGWMPPVEVQAKCATARADATPATLVDVPYGEHFRQTMDVWLAKTPNPAPLVFYLHGGGWAAQDKTDIHQYLDVRGFLDAGISVISVNYRLLQDARAAGIDPPVQWPLFDAARALQFARSKAREWNLDTARIAASGVSAGGCSALWLAMRDNLADPGSADPVARESSRVMFTATQSPQPTLDPKQLAEWIPNSVYGGHAFGFLPKATRAEAFAPFLAARDRILDEIRRYSPIEHAGPGDPPAFVHYPRQAKPPVKGEAQADPTHSAVLGLMLRERLRALNIPCELRYENDGLPGAPGIQQALQEALRSPSPVQ